MAKDKRLQNLRPITETLTREQLSEAGRKGGKASGESKRRKKTMKEALEYLMEVTLYKGKPLSTEKIKSLDGINKLNLTTEQAMLLAMIQKAMNGDTAAFLAIRDTLGEKPDNNVNFNGNVPIVISGDDKLDD